MFPVAEAVKRPPAVAGLFYPDAPAELRALVRRLLDEHAESGPAPKALIAPHAGYVYSGPIAAHAYTLVQPAAARIARVVLIGPSHRWPLTGLAVPSVDAFATPLGNVPLDREAIARLRELPQVVESDAAHAEEHSLEVQLPFLQTVLEEFALVPLVVGRASPEEVAEALELVWGGDETLIVVSSDLSHYHPYADACDIDANTARQILARSTRLIGEQACGYQSINGLLHSSHAAELAIRQLALKNSGDTAGPKRQVVGYGAFSLYAA